MQKNSKTNSFSDFIFYLFGHKALVQEITLRDELDEVSFQQAIKKTAEVHPWIKSVPYEKDGEVFFKITDDPFEAIHHNGSLSFEEDRIKNRLFQITWFKNKIWISLFHILTDGVGLLMFYKTLMYYYFSIKNQKEYKADDICTEMTEDLFNEPFARKLAVADSFEMPLFDKGENAFHFPELEGKFDFMGSGVGDSDEVMFHNNFTVSSHAFMAYCKKNGMTPTVAFEVFMAKALQSLYPENKAPFLASIPVNFRKLAECPNSHKNSFVSVNQKINPDMLCQDDQTLGKKLRTDFNSITNENTIKTLVNKTIDILSEAANYHSIQDKIKFYRKRAEITYESYILTYIGVLPKSEYSDEILDSMWFVYAPIPLITMVDTGGSFSITANSTFDFTKYFTALQAQFEAHGIAVISKKNLGSTKLMDTDFYANSKRFAGRG